MFAATIGMGLIRAVAYGGTPVFRDVSAAALLEFLSLHLLAFAFATFVVTALSRATASRALRVALYAQGGLFLAPFVDVATGLPFREYANTYVGLPGGTPGGILGVLVYGVIVAWGVWDATLGVGRARSVQGVVAGILAVVGLSLLAAPLARDLFAPTPAYGRNLGMAVWDGLLVLLFAELSLRLSSPRIHGAFWRRREAGWLPAFALLPLVGVAAAGRVLLLPNPSEPILGYQVGLPYLAASMAAGLLLWTQRSLIRADALGPLRIEVARLVKVALLALAFLMGPGPFLAAAGAASLAWIEGDRPNVTAFALIVAFAVLIGNASVVAVDFADAPLGPWTLTVPVAQEAWPNPLGVLAAAALGAVALAVTIRTFGSGRARASS